MKLFYSELSANPAYYSFGYSVYGELESTDDLASCYAAGFLPFVGARTQPVEMMYMTRGSRVRVPEFLEHTYHKRVIRKIEQRILSKGNSVAKIEVIEHTKEDFKITDEFITFILTFFNFRFGKEAMPKDRLIAILSSPLLTHIVEHRLHGKPIAYLLEVHTSEGVHVWYHAYSRAYENSHLGAFLYIDLLRRCKRDGFKYAYLGVTYGTWMSYKTNFQPLEYWNGQEWVNDPKSTDLKKLLVADPLRVLGFVDEWRDAHEPYYKAPYPFTSIYMEARYLALITTAMPRIFFGICMIVLVFMLIFGWHYFLD